MGEETTRWTISVDSQTDINLRTFLAQQGMKKGDLSKSVEDAVNRHLLLLTLKEVRAQFADLEPDEAQALVDEAVAAVRNRRTS